MASCLLPKSPVSLSLWDEVPHIFIPKSHLEPREFLISSAKKLLQHNLPTRTSGQTFLDERSYPDDVPVPSFGLRCERCGYAGALRVDHGVSANRPHMLTG